MEHNLAALGPILPIGIALDLYTVFAMDVGLTKSYITVSSLACHLYDGSFEEFLVA